MTHVFIDTNIFLSFYQCSNEDLSELAKLSNYIRDERVYLHVPEQVKDEFWRNRDTTINEELKKLRSYNLPSQFPRMCMGYDEYTSLHKSLQQCAAEYKSLLEVLENDIANESLNADLLISHVFSIASTTRITDEIIASARTRIDLGNPPRKSNSIGDAINWETLLSSVPNGQDLYVVSRDSDFRSSRNKEKFNSFLEKEWISKKNSRLHFFTTLGKAFKELSLSIKLSEYIDKSNSIRDFSFSPTFQSTHDAVAKLVTFDYDFDNEQFNNIIMAATSNTQVEWIFWDIDIQEFFQNLLDGRMNDIYRETLEVFQPWLAKYLQLVDQTDILPAMLARCQEVLNLDIDKAPPKPDNDIPF